MLTTFEQVREWIIDNGLKRWMLFKDYSRKEKILDSNAFPSDLSDKIAMTEKYLRLAGGHAYAAGGTTAGANDMDVVAEIRLQDIQAQPTQGVSGGISGDQIGEIENRLRKSITSELEAKMRADQMERERKEFEKEKKQFEADRNGVIGALVRAAAPYLPVLNQIGGSRLVAGMDAQEPVHAAPIVVDNPTDAPEVKEPEEKSPWDDFTEEEGAELGELLSRFKKIEPEYLTMIRKVVKMAEAGDKQYQIARMALV